MDPISLGIVAGVSVISGLVQYYNAEKARGAEKKRLDEIEALFNKIKPPDYNVSIVEPPEVHQQAIQMPQFSDPATAPQWNLDKLEPKDLKQVQKFTPEVAPLILEAEPKLIEKSPEMAQGLEAQKSALRRFMSIGEGKDGDPLLAQKLQDAKRSTQAEAQSRAASIAQDFERRGLGGSGMELAAKIGAASQAMDRNAQMGMAAEAEAYRNQLNALAQGANLGGQIYGQEQSTQARNADTINAFNQRMSKRQQDWEQMRADALNNADLRNIQEAQRIADYNTMAGNQAAMADRARLDDLTKFNYGANINERNRADDLAKWKYGAQGQERAYQDARDVLNRKWKQENIDRQNAMKQRQYADQMQQASNKAGIGDRQIAATLGRAQDTNAAIQGLANVGAMYGMNMGQQNQANQRLKQEQDFKREMLAKYGSTDVGYGG